MLFNIRYPANANGFSAYGNSSFLVKAVLLLLEIINVIKRDSGSFFRLLETPISKSFILASRDGLSILVQFLRQQSAILKFFKVEATFLYIGMTFFNKSFIRLMETDFLSSGNSVFNQSYFSASGSHYWN